MKHTILAVLAVFLAVALPASAAKPQALDLAGAAAGGQFRSWIEQQDDWPQPEDFIRNSVFGGFDHPCAWSVDDHLDWVAGGYLDPDASSTSQVCIVSDFNPVYATRYGTTGWHSMAAYGFFGVSVPAPLAATVCYSPQRRCFTGQTFCGRVNYRPDDPALQDIADSHGGRGVITTITLTVSNPTAKRVRDVVVRWGISSDVYFPAGCSGYAQTHSDYPFVWS